MAKCNKKCSSIPELLKESNHIVNKDDENEHEYEHVYATATGGDGVKLFSTCMDCEEEIIKKDEEYVEKARLKETKKYSGFGRNKLYDEVNTFTKETANIDINRRLKSEHVLLNIHEPDTELNIVDYTRAFRMIEAENIAEHMELKSTTIRSGDNIKFSTIQNEVFELNDKNTNITIGTNYLGNKLFNLRVELVTDTPQSIIKYGDEVYIKYSDNNFVTLSPETNMLETDSDGTPKAIFKLVAPDSDDNDIINNDSIFKLQSTYNDKYAIIDDLYVIMNSDKSTALQMEINMVNTTYVENVYVTNDIPKTKNIEEETIRNILKMYDEKKDLNLSEIIYKKMLQSKIT